MRIDVHTQSFNTGVPDANGATWWITEMEGWDAPNQRQSFTPPTSRHGTVIAESMLDYRVLNLTGVVKSPSESVFWVCYNALLGLANNLVADRQAKVYETTTKRLGVIRGGPPRIKFKGVGTFEFQLSLVAVDPLKYNDTLTTVAIAAGATVALTNNGTFDTRVTATLTGAGTVSLKNLSLSQSLGTGTTSLASGAVIDFNKRTVYEGTVNKYSVLDPYSVWWVLQPGTHSIQNNGSAPVSITYRDAWI